jgi:hypothetical protein
VGGVASLGNPARIVLNAIFSATSTAVDLAAQHEATLNQQYKTKSNFRSTVRDIHSAVQDKATFIQQFGTFIPAAVQSFHKISESQVQSRTSNPDRGGPCSFAVHENNSTLYLAHTHHN